MLLASETSRCRAESRFIGIGFAKYLIADFLQSFEEIPHFVGDDINPIFLSAPLSC